MCRQDEGERGAGSAMKIRWLLLFLLCAALTLCRAAATERGLISAAEGAEQYSEVMESFLLGYEIRKGEDTFYAEVSQGNAAICFDVQAIPAVKSGVGRYWYPHVSAAVVIAADRTRTDAVITGWNSLRDTNVPVGMSSFSVIRNMLAMGAVSYGLNTKEPEKENTLELLEYLYRNGGFELDGSNAPILICLDYEAALWNRNGANYEIIVPEEGTLSYRIGLLSDVPLTFKPGVDSALLSAGMPLANGERPEGFPDDYHSAAALGEDDYGWFLKITGDSSRDLRRQVLHARLYTTADLREHILSAMMIMTIILLWKGTVSHRMTRRDVRWVVGAMSWIMVGWLLLRLFKYQLNAEDALCRLCWYGYYIFQLALPVALLYLTEILDCEEGEKHLVNPLWPPFVCYVMSVLLVMSNDFHQLVFRFEPGGNWEQDYHYGLGYWIVTAFALLFLALAIINLIRKGYRSHHIRGRMLPLMFCAVILVYLIAYIKRVPLAWESDFTVCVCAFSVLFFEATLHAGLIPVNIHYRRLFSSAPINLTLLDENGCAVLASPGVRPVSRSVWKRLLTDMQNPLLRDNDTQFHAVPIRSGMAVWQEDISQLNRLKKEIKDVQIRLEAANTLLREEGEVKKRLLTAKANQTLFEQLDRDMERRIASLTHLIETLPEVETPKSRTAYIILCLCHIKRRCNLFFLARQGAQLMGDELGIYLDELAELARYAGLQMLIRCGQREAVEIRRAALCYDFAFETISMALNANASPLMGYLEQENDCLMFRFLPGGDMGKLCFTEEMMTAISGLGGQIVSKDLDDAVGICMTLPLGGETCG